VTPSELEALTFAHMPRPFFRSALLAIFQAYRVGWADCRPQFSARQFDNIVGHYVRSKLEDALQGVADRFGMATAIKRAPGSRWNRTEVHSGPILLVEHAVDTPCALLEYARYRETLAESNQLRFQFPDDPRAHQAPLYVALLHSRSQWGIDTTARQRWGHLPGSAYLAFPAADMRFYVHDINLFELFPDVVRAQTPNEWDTDAQVRYLDRARKARAL
jgi:hypothetical protein